MHFGFGGFGMVLFWVVLAAAIILLVKVLANSFGKSESNSNNPLDLLKKRYVTGEITRSEYEVMKHDLLER